MSDINQRDKSGETMLMKAAEMGHANKVISLLVSRADTRLTDKNGVNAKQKALQRGHETVSKIIQAAEDTTPPVSRDKLIRIKEKGSMNDVPVVETSQKVLTLEQSNRVVITDIKIGFWSMVVLMVKGAIAAIPALIILTVIFMTGATTIAVIFSQLMGGLRLGGFGF